MDKNNYNPSLLHAEDRVCYFCGPCLQTARREVFYGTGARTLSKRYGLWVTLCPSCHADVHDHPDGARARQLWRDGKLAFIKHVNCEDEFNRIFVKGNIKHWEIKE